jgi:DNA excision repair protein ERCC-6
MVSRIRNQTNLYANRDKNDANFKVTIDEINKFIGILLLSGYNMLPSERSYWSKQPDLGVPIVIEAMSRNRFQQIKSYIHLADNLHLQQGNKMAKVQQLYDEFNENIKKFGIFDENLSIDESMVPYQGQHGCKMFIKGKPIRFGFKIWCLCAPNGYPYQMDIYTGKSEGNEPLGSKIINNMVAVISEHSDTTKHHLYMDNFFSSRELYVSMTERNIKATGTIRENRTGGANRMIGSKKEMKRTTRGTNDFRCDGKVFVNCWNDNSIVYAISNTFTHEPLHDVKRWKKGKGQVTIKQPDLIFQYNKYMGGVDSFDRLLSSYRPVLRSRKWWWPLFSNILNAAVVAAWRLHCSATVGIGISLSHLEFRRMVVLCLLKESRDAQRSGGRHVSLPAPVSKYCTYYLLFFYYLFTVLHTFRYDSMELVTLQCLQHREGALYAKKIQGKCV